MIHSWNCNKDLPEKCIISVNETCNELLGKITFPFCSWSGLRTANVQAAEPCFSLPGWVPPVQFMPYSSRRLALAVCPYQTHWSWHYHTHTFLFQPPQILSFWYSCPSQPLFSQRAFMTCIHRCLMSSFPSEQLTHGYLQAPQEQRVTVQVRDTHTPHVRPVDGTPSRQIYLFRYLHIYKYKRMNKRLLNCAHCCEVIFKILFLSFVFLPVKDL